MATESDVYRELQKHLHRLPVGYPPTKSGVEINLLKSILTQSRSTHLDYKYKTIDQIFETGGCHVDANMVEKAIESLPLSKLDLILLENLGNLVHPAETDTGAFKNIVILSVPEGDDKSLKYPLIFTVSDALVVNKLDYMDMADFDLDRVI